MNVYFENGNKCFNFSKIAAKRSYFPSIAATISAPDFAELMTPGTQGFVRLYKRQVPAIYSGNGAILFSLLWLTL